MTYSFYENLPISSELAFLELEERFREECEEAVARDSENTQVYRVNYISKVIGAIQELGLEQEFSTEVPGIEDLNYATYINFSKDVQNYTTRLLIRTARRTQGYSVKFDAKAKTVIRHLIGRIRETVDKLEVADEKRDALYKRLSALELEVDRDRTRLEVYADFVLSAAAIVGKAGEKLEPVQKLLDSITDVFREARETMNDTLRLPSPPKRIEHKHPKPKDDDEVPF